jgi:hypothetical protein
MPDHAQHDCRPALAEALDQLGHLVQVRTTTRQQRNPGTPRAELGNGGPFGVEGLQGPGIVGTAAAEIDDETRARRSGQPHRPHHCQERIGRLQRQHRMPPLPHHDSNIWSEIGHHKTLASAG